jgi:hypothetical protein
VWRRRAVAASVGAGAVRAGVAAALVAGLVGAGASVSSARISMSASRPSLFSLSPSSFRRRRLPPIRSADGVVVARGTGGTCARRGDWAAAEGTALCCMAASAITVALDASAAVANATGKMLPKAGVAPSCKAPTDARGSRSSAPRDIPAVLAAAVRAAAATDNALSGLPRACLVAAAREWKLTPHAHPLWK